MQPDTALITITDNLIKIRQLLNELVLQPRINAIKWSRITKQTPNIKIGYPGQHLASLITGMEGERTGARGNDLCDGSEVKSCSRIDQLDKCNECGAPVARLEELCPECNTDNIKRNNDSKWLFAIRSEDELKLLTEDVKRVLLVIGDYFNFDEKDFNTLRFQTFEIWTNSPRGRVFKELMSNYYNNIYSKHKETNPGKTPAPKNFWPYTFQFYMCNPIRTFACVITNANTDPRIDIQHYVEPDADRSALESVLMPLGVLETGELYQIIDRATLAELNEMLKDKVRSKAELYALGAEGVRANFKGINEQLRSYLTLRDTDRTAIAKKQYVRRKKA
ncbi:MAG TPA: MamI family restriction endonuclease [Blastocatellia bacterium]|nr:MamI family restriction endonuclease [Blastocatellia bacterium]